MRGNVVETDGRTVWVNCGKTGGCLARFGAGGIDVHRAVLRQSGPKGACLVCTHTRPTYLEWINFQALVRKHYRVTVPDRYLPEWVVVEASGRS